MTGAAPRRQLPQPSRDELRLTAVLAALSDEIRLAVVRDLVTATEPLPCSAFVLPVTKATMTYHFRVLREAGIIEQREQGNRRMNRLRRADLDARFPGLLDLVNA
ncbi:helix-turn-helix transcriptional regulator [Micromonospora sp. NPDC126480]|uniref:ArsR/SmtB family transcription factor n=1 Tax=Micromonospora sp. NPDC126480 TaxID=3155312 RepID=UPI00331F69C5